MQLVKLGESPDWSIYFIVKKHHRTYAHINKERRMTDVFGNLLAGRKKYIPHDIVYIV